MSMETQPLELSVLMINGHKVSDLATASLIRGANPHGRTEWYVTAVKRSVYAGPQGMLRVGLADRERHQWWGEGIVSASIHDEAGRVTSIIHVAGSGDLRAGYLVRYEGGPLDATEEVLSPGEPAEAVRLHGNGRYVRQGDKQDGEAHYSWEPGT